MSKLVWDEAGSRFYETGTSNGVLYVYDASTKTYGTGVAWNGLTAVTESPEGAEANDLYADNIKYATLRSAEKLKFTIEAYTYPDEFAECDGSKAVATGVYVGQQARKNFGFVYKTLVGDDTTTDPENYKLHVYYGCSASPSEKAYATVNDSPEAITFSWEVETTPTAISAAGYKPSASISIDTSKLTATQKTHLAVVESKLFGDTSSEPTLMTIDEIITEMTKTS